MSRSTEPYGINIKHAYEGPSAQYRAELKLKERAEPLQELREMARELPAYARLRRAR